MPENIRERNYTKHEEYSILKPSMDLLKELDDFYCLIIKEQRALFEVYAKELINPRFECDYFSFLHFICLCSFLIARDFTVSILFII